MRNRPAFPGSFGPPCVRSARLGSRVWRLRRDPPYFNIAIRERRGGVEAAAQGPKGARQGLASGGGASSDSCSSSAAVAAVSRARPAPPGFSSRLRLSRRHPNQAASQR